MLQEIWKNAHAKAITEALAPLGYEVVRPKGCTLIGKEGGLLVAVRQPLRIVSWSFTPFRKSTFIDSLARKGVLAGGPRESRCRRRPVRRCSQPTRWPSTRTRERRWTKSRSPPSATQALQILSLLEQRSQAGSLPALLVGDFNVGPGYADASYRLIADAPGIREAGAVAAPGEALVTWDPGNPLVHYGDYPNEPAAKIDHVFLQGREHGPLAGCPERASSSRRRSRGWRSSPPREPQPCPRRSPITTVSSRNWNWKAPADSCR